MFFNRGFLRALCSTVNNPSISRTSLGFFIDGGDRGGWPTSSSAEAGREQKVTPAAFAALLLGASTALMFCGWVTLLIGFMLMPWVFGLVVLLYFAGIVSTISGFSRSVRCQASTADDDSSVPRKEIPGISASYLASF